MISTLNDGENVADIHGSAGTVGLPADMTRNNSGDSPDMKIDNVPSAENSGL